MGPMGPIHPGAPGNPRHPGNPGGPMHPGCPGGPGCGQGIGTGTGHGGGGGGGGGGAQHDCAQPQVVPNFLKSCFKILKMLPEDEMAVDIHFLESNCNRIVEILFYNG